MTLKEIAAIAMDEADAEASMSEETAVMDAPSPAPGGKPPAPAPGASPAPGGNPPQQPSVPSGMSGAAQKLASDLSSHDARFHPNGFDPRTGHCKFRDKVAAQAKALGLSDVKGLGVSATGESVDAVKNTDAWKDYQTQRNAIDENFRKKLKEKGLRENLNDDMTDLTDDEKAALKEYHQQIDAERDGYIRQTLGDAEADCVDQLADFMKEGGERAAKAKEVAERIRDQFPEGDPRHEGALKVIEMSTRAELLDSSLKIVGEIKEASVAEPVQQPSVEEPLASPPSPDGQSQIAQSQTPSPQPSAQEQQPSDAPTAQNSPEPENFGTIKGTDKEYVDLSGMDFWSSIKAAFDAGFAGKEIVTKLDKMKGRWDEIQASDPKVKEQMDALKGGMQEHMLSEAEKGMFTNLLSRDDLTDIQKDEIKDYQKMLSEAKSASDRVKARRQIKAYLKSEGIVDDKDSEKVKPKPMRESTYDGPVAGIGLLGTPTNSTGSKSKADQAGKDIEDKFKKIGIDAKLESVRPGPAVARAVFEVGDGFNWGNLKNKALKEALASACGAQDVSLERVPGEKNKIAANIKNSKREYVTAADVVNSTAWKDMMEKGAQLPVAIGKAADGRDLCADMTKLTHLLVTGETNSGKSVALNTMITSLLAAVGPGKVRLAMADPKKTEFSNYESNPALGWPVAKDAKSGASLIASIRAEMERRKDIIGLETEEFDPSWDDAKRKEYEETLEKGGRNIADYNKNNPDSNLDYLVCCIDELAEITKDPTYGPQAKADLDQIMALGRALGIHCILSTQRATVDSVPGSIKANIPSKLVFKAKNATDSVSALGHGGAENLLSEGDGIFEPRGGNEVNFQGAFTSDSVINGVQKFYRDNWRTGDAAKSPAPAPSPASQTAPAPSSPTPAPKSGSGTTSTTRSGTTASPDSVRSQPIVATDSEAAKTFLSQDVLKDPKNYRRAWDKLDTEINKAKPIPSFDDVSNEKPVTQDDTEGRDDLRRLGHWLSDVAHDTFKKNHLDGDNLSEAQQEKKKNWKSLLSPDMRKQVDEQTTRLFSKQKEYNEKHLPISARERKIANHLVNNNAVQMLGEDRKSTHGIVNCDDRDVVILNVNGNYVPFYKSSGLGGKADVISGKWYPYFGQEVANMDELGEKGIQDIGEAKVGNWLNKGSGQEIRRYYDSPMLRAICETLDQKYGDGFKAPQGDKYAAFVQANKSIRNPGSSDDREKVTANIAMVRSWVDNLATQNASAPSSGIPPSSVPSPATPSPSPAPASKGSGTMSPSASESVAPAPASPAPAPAPSPSPDGQAALDQPTPAAPAQPPAAPQLPKGIQHMVDSSKQAYDAARQRYSQSRSADDLAAMQSAQSAYHDAVRASRGHATAESNLTKARTDYESAQKALDDAVMNGGDETAAQRKLDAASKALQTARASYDAVERVNKRGDLELRKGQPWESGKDAPVTNLENGMSLAVKNANGGVTTRIRRNDKGIIEVEQGGKWSKAKDQDKAEKSIKNYLTAHTQDGKGLKNITYNGNGEFVATQNRAAVESSSPIVQDELFPAMDSAAISQLLDDDIASLSTEKEENP